MQDLIDELRLVLASADLPPALMAVVSAALQGEGKLLAPCPGSRWPDLVLDCCVAAGGDRAQAIPAAVAMELLMLALDVLDEIEDEDPSPLRDRFGAPQAINATTALLGLAGLAIGRLGERGVPAADVLRSYQIVARTVTTATGGQHVDLAAESGPALTQQQIEEMVARKSGALVGGCCELGAAVAGAPPATLTLYQAFGREVGIAAQLDNDMHDLWHTVSTPAQPAKSDLRRHKQTVPLAFLRDTILPPQPLADALWSSGALPYAWAMVQMHRAAAHALLEQIDALAPVPGAARAVLGRVAMASGAPVDDPIAAPMEKAQRGHA